MPGIDSRSAGIEKGQVENRAEIRRRLDAQKQVARRSPRGRRRASTATERTSSNPRNHVAWRLANCRVRAWTRSIVWLRDASPASMAMTSR